MCAALACTPTQLSPIKFHNSVHNAAVGYWTIGTGCQQASSALSAYRHTFAAALLEAATQCAADEQAVLLVGFEADAVGPFLALLQSTGLLAGAFVLSPTHTERAVAALDWQLVPGATRPPAPTCAAAQALPASALADLLPVFEALATLGPETPALRLPLSDALALELRLRPA
jgi:hypothetical protein